jgi:hypothetical protein
MAKKEDIMVWSDKTGKYKMGYSQYLQQQQLMTERLLLVAVVIMIMMLIMAFFYANELIGRIDALNVFSRLFTPGFCL